LEVEESKPGRAFLVGLGVLGLAVGLLLAAYLVVPLQPKYTPPLPPGACPTGDVCVKIPGSAGTPPPGYTASQGHVVSASFYSPDNITIVIGVNATVQWTNQDAVTHTVTTFSAPSGSQGFDYSLASGSSASFTFTVPGTYDYYCTIHPWMGGVITVKGA
jgi:plastocyanin